MSKSYLNTTVFGITLIFAACATDTVPSQIDDITDAQENGTEETTPGTDTSPGSSPAGDSADPGNATDVSNDEQDPDDQDPTPPSDGTPVICTGERSGTCECNTEEGFTTYTWQIAGQDRCFTTYVPPDRNEPLPVLISLDCYTENELGECFPGSGMVTAANEYGFIGICATSADGNWEFGNDGVANDANPTPCRESDSKDITYLRGIFATIEAMETAGTAAPDNTFVWGFSQNGMFAAYTAICHPNKIKALWQGGSGLFVAGETEPLPQMEGGCRKSDFITYGEECIDIAPCEDCQYWPAYPISTTPPLKACIMAYQDDFLYETAAPMYESMTAEGHHATFLDFAATGREHSPPIHEWAWRVGCMEVGTTCSASCESAFVSCMASGAGQSPEQRAQQYDRCYRRGQYTGLAGCESGCAPTIPMLRTIEEPCVVNGICDGNESVSTCPRDCSN